MGQVSLKDLAARIYPEEPSFTKQQLAGLSKRLKRHGYRVDIIDGIATVSNMDPSITSAHIRDLIGPLKKYQQTRKSKTDHVPKIGNDVLRAVNALNFMVNEIVNLRAELAMVRKALAMASAESRRAMIKHGD